MFSRNNIEGEKMNINQNLYFNQNRYQNRKNSYSPNFGLKINVEGLCLMIHNELPSSTLRKEVDASFLDAALVELRGKHWWSRTETAIDLGKKADFNGHQIRYVHIGKTTPEVIKNLGRSLSEVVQDQIAKMEQPKPKRTFSDRLKSLFDRLIVDDTQ